MHTFILPVMPEASRTGNTHSWMKAATRLIQTALGGIRGSNGTRHAVREATTTEVASPAYDSLLLKAMDDQSLAERLINFEIRRCPAISRMEAIDRANRRWERDMNR